MARRATPARPGTARRWALVAAAAGAVALARHRVIDGVERREAERLGLPGRRG